MGGRALRVHAELGEARLNGRGTVHVLVIGGTRFVGRLLVWRLLAAGDRTTLFNTPADGPAGYAGREVERRLARGG